MYSIDTDGKFHETCAYSEISGGGRPLPDFSITDALLSLGHT